MNKFECWLCRKHPVIYSWYQDFSTWCYDRSWKHYLKKHRSCCEFNTMKHCANKLPINPKKAVCYGYVPETCPECGRKIPKRILLKWMDIALFVEHYEDAKQEFERQMNVREKAMRKNQRQQQ